MDILTNLKCKRLFFDGGMGTLLQERGLIPGELPETWNLTRPDVIRDIHLSYLRAGCNIISTNTFGASRLKFDNCAEIITAGIKIAREAVEAVGCGDRYVAYDMGPLGKILKPLGDLEFERAVEIFAENVRVASAAGADLILIETMNDAYETKAAVLAAKENSALPVFVTNAYDEGGKLMTGADPRAMVALLEGLRVDALGINCSLGPAQMLPVVRELLDYSSTPVIVNPNAGLPRSDGGKTLYDVDAEEFSDVMLEIAHMGATLLGGCCGTTPDYIEKTVSKCAGIPFSYPTKKSHTLISSYTHALELGKKPVLIGERINPTGKKKFKEALRRNDLAYIIGEGIAEEEHGADVLDVNVGLPEINETEMMTKVVTELQAVSALPLQIDTVDPASMEAAMRIYNGKPLVNSVNGKEESLSAVLPLVAKYGGVLIALTLDEKGIPDTAQGRFEIAEKIVQRASEYGIDKKDIIADPLAMAISSDANGANVTLGAVKSIREKLGICTSLGVSNISFGLPNRDFITSTFFAMALTLGLDCAIMNPFSAEMMKVYRSYLALRGMDENCSAYIEYASGLTQTTESAPRQSPSVSDVGNTQGSQQLSPLCYAIVKGLREKAYDEAIGLTDTTAPLDIINTFIIPALDIVGKGFEDKTIYLPQLLMSAEAAKAAFDAVRTKMDGATSSDPARRIVLATVKGDIHDIGKNIVKVLLQNYGFDVIDLGKDVPPEEVCRCVCENKIRLVGLSALMTTTVPSMEKTIKMLRESSPETKVVVGGAVLTQEYADMIGADKYCRDAMQTVRFAEEFFASDGHGDAL